MPLARFSKLSPDKQVELLTTATEEFAERGFDAASLSDILVKTGLSKSSFYYYFEDKEDLLAAVLERLMNDYFPAVGPREFDQLTQENFWRTVERQIEQSTQKVVASPALMKVLSHLPLSLRESPQLAPIRERAARLMASVISAGQKVGCVRTDLSVERLTELWEAMDASLDRALMGQDRTPTAEEMEAHMRLVFDTFRRLMVPAGSVIGGGPGKTP